jgi:hypothetical protein
MDGRIDRHDEANNRFSQFCERAEHCTAEFDEVGKNGNTFKIF